MTRTATVFATGGTAGGNVTGFRTSIGAFLALAGLALAAAADDFLDAMTSDDDQAAPWPRPTDGEYRDAWSARTGISDPLVGPDGVTHDPAAFRWSDAHPAMPPNPDGSTSGAWIPADAWPWSPPTAPAIQPQDGQDGPQDAPDGDGPSV